MSSNEALDLAAVTEWLRATRPDLPIRGLPEVAQYAGGASNWTYRLKFPELDLVLRRPPAGTKAKSAHDMGREFRIQQALKPAFPVVPMMIGLCRDETVIGAEFYVMERIAGPIARRRFPPEVQLDEAGVRRLCFNFVDKLVELHRVDYRAIGLESLSRGPGYAKRQVAGWSERYLKARTPNVPTYERVRAWLAERAPEDVGACVIHNDWRFDNVVLDPADPTRIIGVLDWELATIGDPLMELGSALAYWIEREDGFFMKLAQRQPTDRPGMLTRDAVVDHYAWRTGRRIDDWSFYEVFGLFRLAVIAQQIYYRYFHRQTRNPAFKNFWILINYFDWRCQDVIRRGKS